MAAKTYTGTRLDVTFDPARCLHAAECLRGLPAVFDTSRRPWILPDDGDAEEVAAVVARCPTGALHVENTDIDAEPHGAAALRTAAGEPMWARGDLSIEETSGEPTGETRAALCTCGRTGNVPFCDASGPCTDWRD